MKRIGSFLILLIFIAVCHTEVYAQCGDNSITINEDNASLCPNSDLRYTTTVTTELSESDYAYQWKKSTDNVSFSDVDSETEANLDVNTSTAGTYYYKCEFVPNNGCDKEESNTVSVTVYADLTSGTIGSGQTICYDTKPTAISQTTTPTGSNGTYTYQWQQKTDGDWSDISSATTTTYQPAKLKATTQYRLKVTSLCGTAYTNAVTIMVRPDLTAPTINTIADSICYNSAPDKYTVLTEATGGADDSFTYQWFESTDSTTFSSISGETALEYQPTNLTADHFYKVVVTSVKGCGERSSAVEKVKVFPDLAIAETGTEPLCYMSSGEIKVSATGEGGAYTYQWQEYDGSEYQNIASATNAKYTTTAKTDGTYTYRCVVTPTNGCTADNSAPIEVTVYADLTPGTIGSAQTICYNTQPAAISQITAPTGSNGTYTYQWQQKVDGDWSDVASATVTTYQPAKLKATTQYRLKVTSQCGTVYTDAVTITVRPDLTAPTINTIANSICYNSAPDKYTVVTEATGGADDTFTYQWFESANGTTFTAIENETALEYQPTNLTADHFYKVVATSVKGCGERSSVVEKVKVFSDLVITETGTDALCYMTSGEISVKATGEGGSYTYQWQEYDGSAYQNIASATNAKYTTTAKTDGTYTYRCVVTPTNGCTADNSAPIEVSVYADLTSGTIGSDQTICYDTKPTAISQTTTPTGSNGTYTYQWQQKTDGDWSDISSATTTTYQPAKLKATTQYRLKVTSLCGTVYTDAVTITVRPDLTAPTINTIANSICYNSAPDKYTVLTEATGGADDTFTYQWFESANGTTFTAISGETSLEYQPTNLTDDHFYKVVATSVKGCGERSSAVEKVKVFPDLAIAETGTDALCYMTSGEISVIATGEGGSYSYQWQEYDGSEYQNIASATNAKYTTAAKTDGTYTYRCVVTPTNGCTADNSAPIEVLVYADLTSGTIGSDQTICYNTQPAAINQITAPTGSNGAYTYQWQQKTDSEWNNITGEDSTAYQPDSLTATVLYRLQVSSQCGVVETPPIAVTVRADLTSPIISTNADSICYNSAPDKYTVLTEATGGADDSFTYQWFESADSTTFSSISGETSLEYQPVALIADHYYKVVATSVKGCGERSSAVEKVKVFPDLAIAETGTDALCYMTSGEISVKAIGEGGSYSYQWQELVNADYQDIAEATAGTFATAQKAEGTYTYRCIVSPTNGCESDISEPIEVLVYAELKPSSIVGNQEVCYTDDATELHESNKTQGGSGKYTYQWQSSADAKTWKSIDKAKTTTYRPTQMTVSTYYRIESTDLCGSVVSDTVFVLVNPLPEPQDISGSEMVCANSFESYSVERLNNGFSYMWLLENAVGQIQTEPENTANVEVLWHVAGSANTVKLQVTNDKTGCLSTNHLAVETRNDAAPDRTIIVRKPNSNILVCKADNDEFLYRWGFTDRATGERTEIENADRRYVMLPHNYDNAKYEYWLDLYTYETSVCHNLTTHTADDNSQIVMPTANVSVSTLSESTITVNIVNPDNETAVCRVYTLQGVLVRELDFGNAANISNEISGCQPNTAYLVQVKVGDRVSTFKTIVK